MKLFLEVKEADWPIQNLSLAYDTEESTHQQQVDLAHCSQSQERPERREALSNFAQQWCLRSQFDAGTPAL